MTNLRANTGITDQEWIQSTVDEAHSDPVGMWRMVRAGREQFGLSGEQLEDFVHRFITQMLASGAVPVVGDSAAEFGWSPVFKYEADPSEAADALVKEWRSCNTDPDVNGVWFASPSVWR